MKPIKNNLRWEIHRRAGCGGRPPGRRPLRIRHEGENSRSAAAQRPSPATARITVHCSGKDLKALKVRDGAVQAAMANADAGSAKLVDGP